MKLFSKLSTTNETAAPQKKRRRLPIIGLIAGLTLALPAAAATLDLANTDSVQAGNITLGSCDTDGVDVDYPVAFDVGTDRFQVTFVGISDIDPACDGKEITVVALDAAGTELAQPVAITIDDALNGGTEVIPVFSFDVSAEDFESLAVFIG